MHRKRVQTMKMMPRLDDDDETTVADIASLSVEDEDELYCTLKATLDAICENVLPSLLNWKTCKFKHGMFENRTPRGNYSACFSLYMTDDDFPHSTPKTILDVDTIEVTMCTDTGETAVNDISHEFKTPVKARCYVMMAALKRMSAVDNVLYVTKNVAVDHAKAKAFSEYTKQDYTSILKAKEVKLNANVEATIDFPKCKTLEELTLMLAISGDLKK